MKNSYLSLVGILLLSACSTWESRYTRSARESVLSVVSCVNPEVLLSGAAGSEVDHEAFYEKFGKVAYSFEKVDLGPEVVGYRADLIPCGQGWGGYHHARLLVVQESRLVSVFDLAGPYLFVETTNIVNGRYGLWHWVGDNPVTAVRQYYTFADGEYVKTERSRN